MAARFCPQCGREISSTAQFCTNCGAALSASAAQVTPVAAAATTTRRLLVPAMVTALIVLAIAVAILAKARQPVTAANPQPPAPSLLSAPSAPPAAPAVTNVASTPPAPSAPITNSASKPAPQLPADVAAYLKFLQGIEQRRQALDNDTSGAAAMMQLATQMQSDQSNPDAQGDSDQSGAEAHNDAVPKQVSAISQGYAAYVAKWNALTADFRSVNPPAECSLLANAYLAFLTDYVATISKIQVALINHDIGTVMTLQGAQKQVTADALQADQQLGDLCSRYGVAKPFDIQVDGGSSPLTGM